MPMHFQRQVHDAYAATLAFPLKIPADFAEATSASNWAALLWVLCKIDLELSQFIVTNEINNTTREDRGFNECKGLAST